VNSFVAETRDAAIRRFLEEWPAPIASICQGLREVMGGAFPELDERLRPGWRLIGYDVRVGRRPVYLVWIWPQIEHVHIGWQTGTLMRDPKHLLHGAEENLKKVRYLTYPPGKRIAPAPIVEFTREAIRVASMSRGERDLLAATRRRDMPPTGR
jgi:hypothetical protein